MELLTSRTYIDARLMIDGEINYLFHLYLLGNHRIIFLLVFFPELNTTDLTE